MAIASGAIDLEQIIRERSTVVEESETKQGKGYRVLETSTSKVNRNVQCARTADAIKSKKRRDREVNSGGQIYLGR